MSASVTFSGFLCSFKMILFTQICWLPFPWGIEEGGSGTFAGFID